MKYAEISNRDLDARCAEALGWVPRGPHPIFGSPVYSTGKADTLVPHFSTDANAARELEGEIERRGLQREYTRELLMIVLPSENRGLPGAWYVIHASPRDRAIAFCRAMEGAGA